MDSFFVKHMIQVPANKVKSMPITFCKSDPFFYVSSKSSLKPFLVERFKVNARELLTRKENFGKNVQCTVDIQDHKFQ